MTNKVNIVEMAPRDGLQSLLGDAIVSVDDKFTLIKNLLIAGIRHIEVGAFVNPNKVPQMANTDEVVTKLRELDTIPNGTRFSVLVPNKRGLERTIEQGVTADNWEIAIFTSASETFEQNNLDRSIKDSLKHYKPIIKYAKREGFAVRAHVSAFVACPITGEPTSPETLTQVVSKLIDRGVDQIALGDTTGIGTPETVRTQLEHLAKADIPFDKFAGHFHDTYGKAIDNVAVAHKMGITTFDGSAGGLGGCPYAGKAVGNVSTEALAQFFKDKNIETGINMGKLREAAAGILTTIGQSPSGHAL